jgi:Cu-Zn family superoxide dismutase
MMKAIMKKVLLSSLLNLPLLVSAATGALSAEATLAPTAGNTASGVIHFEQQGETVHVTAAIQGLAPGLHGFHIHQNGDCSAPDASSAGGHFNPSGSRHGSPEHAQHHAGDFGNLVADERGMAKLDLTLPSTQLNLEVGNAANVLQRGVIVHAMPDDMETQPTGNSGGRLACGVIAAAK